MRNCVTAGSLAPYLVPSVRLAMNDALLRYWPFANHAAKRFEFGLNVSFVDDSISLAAFGNRITILTRNEIDDGSYKVLFGPRMERWIDKNIPKPHRRFVARPLFGMKRKLARHPTEERI